VFLTRQPSPRTIDAFLRAARRAAFSYREIGCTRYSPPSGYNVDRHRVRLGHGEAVFVRAAGAIRAWRMFELGWVALRPPDTMIDPGATVAIVVHALGVWSLHPCRIVYVLDDTAQPEATRRFGFAYGTLNGHAERGEERFSVEWHRADDSVWYDILAFSRPAHWLARLGYPLSRRLQRRFARDSMRVMRTATAS
jgi:uncharacterized protein (UPF0548 family)